MDETLQNLRRQLKAQPDDALLARRIKSIEARLVRLRSAPQDAVVLAQDADGNKLIGWFGNWEENSVVFQLTIRGETHQAVIDMRKVTSWGFTNASIAQHVMEYFKHIL